MFQQKYLQFLLFVPIRTVFGKSNHFFRIYASNSLRFSPKNEALQTAVLVLFPLYNLLNYHEVPYHPQNRRGPRESNSRTNQTPKLQCETAVNMRESPSS
jgi:hypothetical protein